MRFRTVLIIGVIVLIIVVVVVVVASQLTPQVVNPAGATAVDFVNAAGSGDDATALALLNEPMRAYVADHCPNDSPAVCIRSYTPLEWGDMLSAVFRRAAPDGASWNVEVIANYAEGIGASGVCSLIHMEANEGVWRVAGWAGFVHCGDPRSRDMATNPDTPNRAP